MIAAEMPLAALTVRGYGAQMRKRECIDTLIDAHVWWARREQRMSMTIRYRTATGEKGDDLRSTEADARQSLEKTLANWRARGHAVTQDGNKYVVKDAAGKWAAAYELVPSV